MRKINHEGSNNAHEGGGQEKRAELQEFHGEKAKIRTQKEEQTYGNNIFNSTDDNEPFISSEHSKIDGYHSGKTCHRQESQFSYR